jgi:hypothetical protein
MSWADSSGRSWLFGGEGNDGSGKIGSLGFLNDLWEFDPSTNEWAWMGGSSTFGNNCELFYGSTTLCGQPGVYGLLGTPAVGNVPGARFGQVNWTDSSGNLWLFGGGGYDADGAWGYLNDLWKYWPPLTTATTTTLHSSSNTSNYGASVTLTATVSSSSGAPPDGESVTFLSGTTTLGTAQLSSGTATLTTTALPVGTDAITAVYGGDANFSGSASNTVSQVVLQSPNITVSPVSQTVAVGSTATFSVTATGTPTLSYAWQYLSGSTWKPFAAGTGLTSASMTTFATTAAYNGLQFRVVVTDGNNLSTASNPVTLTVAPAVTAQPASQIVAVGSTATFSVTAGGVSALTYQWQYLSVGGSTWKTFAAGTGLTTATMTTFATTPAYNGLQFRVVVTGGNGLTTTSNTATLTVAPAITIQPANQTLSAGSTATFSVAAAGVAPLTYVWQYLAVGGSTWKPFAAGTGTTTASLTTFNTTPAYSGLKFRVVVTDGNGLTATSNTATLTVAPAISAQPTNQTVAAGSTATFSVTASGVGTLTYAWQYLSVGGSTWKPFAAGTGLTTATMTTFATTPAYNGLQLRVVVTDGNGFTATSNAATLTVAPAITIQPVSQSVSAGSPATFSVTATGVPTLTYVWKYLSVGGSTWKTFAAGTGLTTATMTTFATTPAYNGLQFRVVVTDGNSLTATSNTATLTVH